jgi:hypothetical protein
MVDVDPAFSTAKKEPTSQELADAFAAQALKAALDPPLDGLNILDEIRKSFRGPIKP